HVAAGAGDQPGMRWVARALAVGPGA
ncbi:MAG: hypothetical protein K0R11_251, partial [Acidimicrobiales bacterium]|nr:hypothetical protein [Acidimicrobiales bacterium]